VWIVKERAYASLPSNLIERTSGWSQIDAFSDEFTGSSLNLAKWDVYDSFCHVMSPKAYFSNSSDNVKVEGGKVKLRVKSLPDSVFCSNDNWPNFQGYYHYSSGYIALKNTIQYGYIELKCYLPSNSALNPSYWLYQNNDSSYDEIDVFEKSLYSISDTVLLQNFYHNIGHPDTAKFEQRLTFNQGAIGDTAIFAIEWLPEELNYYINGNIVSSVRYTQNQDYIDAFGHSNYTCTDFIYAIPQFLQLSLSVNKEILNNPDISEWFDIDYVKTFKLKAGGDTLFWPNQFSMTDPDMFKVHDSVRLGGPEHSAIIPSGVNATMWAKNSIVFDTGCVISANTNFTARTIKTQPALFKPAYNDEETNEKSN
jgi:beta-glucanase (GH16 family)